MASPLCGVCGVLGAAALTEGFPTLLALVGLLPSVSSLVFEKV